MKAKKWIVTAVDTGDTADGKPHVLKVCNTKEAAKEYVRTDMDDFVARESDMDLAADYDGMSIYNVDYSFGCEWNIEVVEIEV